MFNFKNKTAIVTGSSKGIGKQIALKLAEQGANVILNSRNLEEVQQVEDEFKQRGFSAVAFTGSVNIEEDANSIVNGALEHFGSVDILVNNAGITRDGLVLRMSERDWDDVMSINLKGAFLCTKAVAKSMFKKREGRIINISSVIGLMGNAGQANYAASKAGIIGFTKSIAREFGSRNITCNAITPGFIATNMTEELNDKIKEDYLSRIPLGKFGSTEDVANIVSFLASDVAGYITGQVISVDGGLFMY